MDSTEVKEAVNETPVAEPTGIEKIEAAAEALKSAPVEDIATTKPDGAPPVYNPNFKFKVHDKEHEFDEWIRSSVKDADTEKKAKELYEKAYGLDFVKPKYESANKEREELRQAYNTLHTDVAQAMEYKNKGDFETFFKKVGLTDEQVAQYIIDKANRQNLPPDQKRVYDELDSKKRAEIEHSRQIATYEQRWMQMATQARAAELDSVLARNDVNQTVQKYDSINGHGAFRNFVAEYGVMHHTRFGEDPSAQDAVSAVMKRLGDAYISQQASAPSQGSEKPLPIIPNVSGKNLSPIRKTPKSVEDLRKMSASMREQSA